MSGRIYRQTARAAATEATRRRIVEAFVELSRDRWFDEITLADVAAHAGTTVRTALRHFSGKDGLVAAVPEHLAPQITARRAVRPGDVGLAIERLFELYETSGDAFLRFLALEQRFPVLAPLLEAGRAGHRAVTAANFAPWLEALPASQRGGALDAVVIATDVYAWKLLRRDMGRSEAEAKAALRGMVEAIMAGFSERANACA